MSANRAAECLLPPPLRVPARFKPVFVLATSRSYSSVVTGMIGQHPQLAALPELKLFAYDTIADLEASLPPYWITRGFTHRSPGLVRAVAQVVFGSQTARHLCLAREWLRARADWRGADVFDSLLERLTPRAAVEKSPENVESDEALERLKTAYPAARFLHLTRHPITTQRSIQEHLQRTVPGFLIPGQPMAGVAYWVEVHSRILAFAASIHEQAWMRVRAEDVLNDAPAQLERIAVWLGLSTGAGALEAMRHPEASPFACPAPPDSGLAGGNDPAFLQDPIPHRVAVPCELRPPAGWKGNAALWDRAIDLANQLGYG